VQSSKLLHLSQDHVRPIEYVCIDGGVCLYYKLLAANALAICQPAMQTTTSCPHCSAKFQVSTAVLGKRTRCTKCGQGFVLAECPEAERLGTKSNAESKAKEQSEQDRPSPEDTTNQSDWSQMLETPAIPPDITIDTETPVQRTANDIQSSTSTPRKFIALKVIASFYEIIATLMGVAILIVFLFLAIDEGLNLASLIWLFSSMVSAAFIMGIANVIRLFLHIENNTFEASQSLSKLKEDIEPLLHAKIVSNPRD